MTGKGSLDTNVLNYFAITIIWTPVFILGSRDHSAAFQGGAEILLSEDLNHGQVIEGIRIENPFKT